jgi:hypothetical protein
MHKSILNWKSIDKLCARGKTVKLRGAIMKKLVLTVLFVFALSSIGMAAPLMDYSKGKVGFDYTYRPSVDFDGSIGYEGSYVENNNGEITRDTASQYWSGSFDGKANLDWGLTIGLGNNFAFQYKGFNAKTDRYSYNLGGMMPMMAADGDDGYVDENSSALTVKGKIKTDEMNVLYKVGKRVAAFTGVVRASSSFSPSFNSSYQEGYPNDLYQDSLTVGLPELKSEDKTMWHIGVLGVAPIAKKTNAFGVVSVGKDYRNWEAGISYELAKDWEFNVNYRNMKIDKLTMGSLAISDSYTDGEGSYSSTLSGTANLKDVELKGWGFGVTYKF